ncbi:MAG: hypothetical protein O2955_09100 [Planctomycetota bacterium]|nr:hypothetical protein [Planctomycetota bacterium]MDA1212664.1 hypothetical protein [Planctomycetota bacterium]
MSYIEDVCSPLIRMFDKFATYDAHQLAGQVANLDFWLSEVDHRLSIIDGYRKRFDRLKSAQMRYVKEHNAAQTASTHLPIGASVPPLRPGISHQDLTNLRERLQVAARRFLVRCHSEKIQTDEECNAALSRIGAELIEKE